MTSKFLKIIDLISEVMGKISGWAIFIVMLLLVYEVICRHFFNQPNYWSFDISYMLGGTAALLGSAIALKNKRHVRVDLFYANFSPKKQVVLDIFLSIIFLFPLLIAGLNSAINMAAFSVATQEKIMSGYWRPPIYPMKIMLCVGIATLLLQSIAEFIRNIDLLRKGEI